MLPILFLLKLHKFDSAILKTRSRAQERFASARLRYSRVDGGVWLLTGAILRYVLYNPAVKPDEKDLISALKSAYWLTNHIHQESRGQGMTAN